VRPSTFQTICTLVRQRSSIVLEEGKEYLVESRLKPIARAQGVQDVDELCDKLGAGRNDALSDAIVDAMTTNETSFFRDHVPFDVLQSHVLPSIIEQNAAKRRIDIWSAACSTGQEPYSVAMQIADQFPELAEWDVRIFATDLSRRVLEQAQKGEYRQVEVNRGLTAPQLMRHFTRRGIRWSLNERIRSRVTFERLNLMDRWPPMVQFDVVLLRNVLIYFDAPDRDQVLRRMVEQVRPDGFLFLGGSESPPTPPGTWERIEVPRSGCYRRR